MIFFTSLYRAGVLVRPPATVVPGGLMFYCGCFFSPRDLNVPSADRRKTLPRITSIFNFYKLGPQIWGPYSRPPPPQKKSGPKTCKIRGDFGKLQTSIANISGTDRDIKNREMNPSTAIPPAFGEERTVNFGSLTTKLEM